MFQRSALCQSGSVQQNLWQIKPGRVFTSQSGREGENKDQQPTNLHQHKHVKSSLDGDTDYAISCPLCVCVWGRAVGKKYDSKWKVLM